MTDKEIIKDLEQQIENLKITIKLQEDIIQLYKNKDSEVPLPFNPVWPPLQPPFKPYIGDIIPSPYEITC